MDFPTTRMRRLRKNEAIRDIVRETKLLKEDLIYPIFVKDGLEDGNKEPIITMPDEYRYSVNDAVKYAKSLENKGLKSIIVFGIPIEEEKDEIGTPAFKSTGIVQRTIRQLKAGADVIAPSDMMDGRVGAIREALDDAGYEDVIIMAYSAKFASTFYAPFRDAACSAPGEGNRKSYQMDPANSKEALREVELDIIEGADIVMVKPAFPCLDIIHEVSENFNMPLATYSVSGEYSMLKTAVSENILPEESIMETMIAIKRAGAELIITNFAPYLLDKL